MSTHDVTRQVRQLQQALSSDKAAAAVLLGAGCGSSIRLTENGVKFPLVPDIAGLTLKIREVVTAQETLREPYEHLLRHLAEDGNASPNVEDILSHVRTLRQAAGTSEARGLTGTVLGTLDDEICRITQQCIDKTLPGTTTGYHRLASWISSIRRENAVEVFTTNYDLLMEQALEAQRVPYFDGFAGASRAFFDPISMATDVDRFPSHWCRLWKLHGSVNWWRDGGGAVVRGGQPSGKAPLIHPSHLKYEESRRMPYLAMIDRLRAHLKRTRAVLVTCGFSFADQHLNEVVDEGLQGNPTAVCFGLAYGEAAKYPRAVQLAERRSNMSLWARDRATIGTRTGTWTISDTSETPPEWVAELLPAPPGGSTSGERACQLKLGDFVAFGEFLADQMGTPFDGARATHGA